MIYDNLKNIERYRGISKWADVAIDFLMKTDLNTLPLGRTEISGDKVFANVMEAKALEEEEVQFEIHKKYMDIQIDIQGVEEIQIGLDAEGPLKEYEEEKDFGTVVCGKSASCIMGAGRFIVCMGEEPHKPSLAAQSDRYLKKCVLKVAVQ